MMKHSRFALCMLAILLLASCGEKPDDAAAVTTAGAEVTQPEEETRIPDGVPELDFDGEELRYLQQKPNVYWFDPEEADGEPVNDALFERNRAAEERFGFKIVNLSDGMTYDVISNKVKSTVTSQDDAYDLVFSQVFRSGKDAASGYFYNWNDLDYVDFDKPWYTKSIKEASVGSNLFMVESDLMLGYAEQTWMMLYNTTKAASLNLPDLYDIVYAGEWTLDKLYELSSTVYSDVNGNSRQDDGDLYGFAATQGDCLLAAYLYAGNGRMVDLSEDLELSYPIGEEHSINVLTKISRLFYDNPGAIKKPDALGGTRRGLFPTGNILFEPMLVGDLMHGDLRAMEDSFGVLPMPKYDAAQSEYYTVIDGGADIMTIPVTITRPEMIAAAVESMSADSYYDVIPVYTGLALEQKGVRDEESIAMLRSILDSRVIDFGYLYDASSGYTFQLKGILSNPGKMKSTIDSKQKPINKHYEKMLDALTAVE